MKKMFLTLALMFIGSFTFANNTEINIADTNLIELTERVTTQKIANPIVVVVTVVTITDYYLDGVYIGSTVEVDVYVVIIE